MLLPKAQTLQIPYHLLKKNWLLFFHSLFPSLGSFSLTWKQTINFFHLKNNLILFFPLSHHFSAPFYKQNKTKVLEDHCKLHVFHIIPPLLALSFLKILFIHSYREGKWGRKRGKELLISCTHPRGGPGPQLRHVPWWGIESATLCFEERSPTNWATLGRVSS